MAGVAGLVLATMAFTAAYIAPYWLQQDGDQTLSRPGLHIGIWFQCRRSDGDCQSHNFSADDGRLVSVYYNHDNTVVIVVIFILRIRYFWVFFCITFIITMAITMKS